jgi:uncharacterized protein (UPF0264 family)
MPRRPQGGVAVTGLLASVTNIEEARIVLDAGADIIDLKDPGRGALGALPLADIRAIVGFVADRRPVSATVGDLPPDPDVLVRAVEATATTGVRLVKVGMFNDTYYGGCLDALAQQAAGGVRLVAVLFADLEPDTAVVERLADAGFVGVMLDTADKAAGGLCRHMSNTRLLDFVRLGKRLNLLTGLAGSLRREDIEVLVPIGADYLGFRTALCRGRSRTAEIDLAAVAGLSAQLGRAREFVGVDAFGLAQATRNQGRLGSA